MAAPIITPGGPLTKDGKSLTHFVANQNVTWTKSGGTLSGVLAAAVDWTAPNQTGLWTLTGTNGGAETDIVEITVRAIIPNYWTWKTPIVAKKEVLTFKPIYGPTQTRGFGDSPAMHDWELGNDDSSFENFQEIKAFWNWHHPGLQFDMIDPVQVERRRYEVDSDYGFQYNHADSYQWSFRIREAWPFHVIA